MTNFANHFAESHFCNVLPITSPSHFIDRQTQRKKLRFALLSDMSAKREPDQDKAHDDREGSEVVQHHQHDILCGRGGGSCKNMGNYVFRNLVAANKEVYLSSTRREKIAMTHSIVEAIRNQNPPGRFLEKDEVTGRWKDIGPKRSLKKVSQSLREGAPHLRKKVKVGNNKSSGFDRPPEGGDYQHYKHRPDVQISLGFGPPMQQHSAGWTMNKPSSFLAHHHGSRFLQNTAVGAGRSQTGREQILGTNPRHEHLGREKIEPIHMQRAPTPDPLSSGEQACDANEEFPGDGKDQHPISDDVGSIDWINVFQALSDDDADEDLRGAAAIRRHTLTQNAANEDPNSTTITRGSAAEELKPSPPPTTSQQLPATTQEQHPNRDRNESSELPAITRSYSPPSLRMHPPSSDNATNPSNIMLGQERSRPASCVARPVGAEVHSMAGPPPHPHFKNTHISAGSWLSNMESSSAGAAFGRKDLIFTAAARASGDPPSAASFASSSHKRANSAIGIDNPFRFKNVRRWRSSNEPVVWGTSSSSSESDESLTGMSRCVSCGRHNQHGGGSDDGEEVQIARGNLSAQHEGPGLSEAGDALRAKLQSFETSWRAAEREKSLLRDTRSACEDANHRKIVDLSKRHAAEVARLRLELKMVTDQLMEERKKGELGMGGDSKKSGRAGSAA